MQQHRVRGLDLLAAHHSVIVAVRGVVRTVIVAVRGVVRNRREHPLGHYQPVKVATVRQVVCGQLIVREEAEDLRKREDYRHACMESRLTLQQASLAGSALRGSRRQPGAGDSARRGREAQR